MADLKPSTDSYVTGESSFTEDGDYQPSQQPGSSNEEERYVCDICGVTFPCRTYLNRHTKNVHVEAKAEHQQCPKCPMKFKKYDTFWEHIVRVHENPAIPSAGGGDNVGDKDNRSRGLSNGVASSIATLKDEQVMEIPDTEEGIEALVDTMISEEDDKKCKKCGNVLCARSNLRRHIREVHLKLPPSKNASGRVSCNICGRTFVNNSVYNSHMKNIHIQTEPTIDCPQCWKKFKEMKSLRKHMRSVHRIDLKAQPLQKPQQRQQLPESSNSSDPPLEETNSDEDDMDKTDPVFTCSICEISFVSINGLNRHNKFIHHVDTDTNTVNGPGTGTPVPRPAANTVMLELQPCEENGTTVYACKECGKKFPSKNAMWGHSVVHQKASLEPHIKNMLKVVFGTVCNSSLVCGICGMEVINTVEGRLHVYIKHPEKFDELVTQAAVSAQGLLPCSYCSEKYPCSESMISHIETAHPDKHIPTCSMCGHRELKERDINLHYKQFHPAVARYSCEICKAPYNQKRELNYHMTREHAADAVQCPYCPERHRKVKLHVTVKHPEKAEEFTKMKKAALREEQIARMRFNQFLDKGTNPRNSKIKPRRNIMRKKVRFEEEDEEEEEEDEEIEESYQDEELNENPEYEDAEDDEVDRKPNVCFVKETPKVTIPELYKIEKPTGTPHVIEVRRLPPPPPAPPEEPVEPMNEEPEDNNQDSVEDGMDVDVKPDINQLQASVSDTQQDTSGRTLVLCLKRLTEEEIAKWMPSKTDTLETHDDDNDETAEKTLSGKSALKRTQKRKRGRGHNKKRR